MIYGSHIDDNTTRFVLSDKILPNVKHDTHYQEFAIQPIEFITKNNIPFIEGCVIKRMCRWRKKDGIKDLEKAKNEIDLLIKYCNENYKVPAKKKCWYTPEGE